MKVFASILAFTSVTSAHYVFPSIVNNGVTTTEWQYVRQWTGYYTNGPVTDISSTSIRCNVDGASKTAQTLNVAAGANVAFTAVTSITHPGPSLVYLAKVPAGKTAATWDGAGSVWFKIFEEGPTFGGSLNWPSSGKTSIPFKIPASVPSGEYLVRVEHIALHSAGSAGGAQFYLSCGQINVTGGGSGTPTGLVAFPGAYKATDPGILINIYYPVPTSYAMPGPAVWKG